MSLAAVGRMGALCVGLLALAGTVSAQAIRDGEVFPPFVEKDLLTGEELKLESFRGKVVIIDYWATWCMPCVAEIPNVKRVYEKYRESGVEVISISLDNNLQTCKNMIEKKGMNWRHIGDGAGWKSKLATRHGIHSIPAVFVLDREGKVIQSRARGPQLEEAVKKALGITGEAPAAPPVATSQPAKPAQPTETTGKAGEWLDIAREMSRAKRYDLSRKFYARVIETYPNSREATIARDELKQLPEG